VTAAASGALERIEALRGELTTLLAALAPDAAAASEAPAERSPQPGSPPNVPAAQPDEASARLVTPAGPAQAPPAADHAAPADDAGARLVALELALSGAPRAQAERVLAEQFSLGDERGRLLDDVYAAAGR